LQLFPGEVGTLPTWSPPEAPSLPDPARIREAAELLADAAHPGLFVGWGARHAVDELVDIAEQLQAPVATTLQGLASFPAEHPLHVGFGFSASAVPAARNAFR